MDAFEREIKVEFLNEAAGSLEDAEQAFLQLENSSGSQETIDQIFRLAHNLKGSSQAVGFEQVGEFTHHWESLLLKIKEGLIQIEKPVVSLLLACLDHVRTMIHGLREDLDAKFESGDLIARMEAAGLGQTESIAEPPPPRGQTPIPEENRTESSPAPSPSPMLAPLPASAQFVLEEFEAQLAEKQPPPTPAGDERVELAAVAPTKKAKSISDDAIRVSTQKLERLIDYVGEMVILQSVLREQIDRGEADSGLMRKAISQLGKVGKEIQDVSMSLRMLPIKPSFQKMHRVVRDTALSLGKEVILQLYGEETEVDKTVLERLSDPLVHLIRNSVDHGIEDGPTREANGKPSFGTVILTARQQAGKMVIEVSDDGGGINPQKVLKKAWEKGLLKEGQVLSDREAYQLIFLPGFTTKEQVTEVSGRGVGMDVVKTNIESIGGEIQVESKMGEGSTFRIVLPLTLAILECTVVRCGEDRYVIPSYHISESLRADASILRDTLLGEVLLLRGENLPVLRLRKLLRSRTVGDEQDPIALIVRSGNQPFALIVDDIIGQYQVVTKPLSPELRNLKGVSGSTILGDGKPALILEVNQYAMAATRRAIQPLENRGAA